MDGPFGWLSNALGVAGFVLAVVVYRRDSANVSLQMVFDMTALEAQDSKTHTLIIARNSGRRTAYLEKISVPVPWEPNKGIIFADTRRGITLPEGSAPHIVNFHQDAFDAQDFATRWWLVRAQAWDASGRQYRSRWITERPSWGVGEAPPVALLYGHIANWVADKARRFLT